MTDFDAHVQSLMQVQTLQPTSFDYSGGTFRALRGGASRAKQNELGGFSTDADLVLIGFAEDFGDASAQPQPKEKLSCEGKTYRVDEVITPAGAKFFKLRCVDPNRGA